MEIRRQKTEDGRPIKMRLLGSLRELAMTTFIFSICFLSPAYANNIKVSNCQLLRTSMVAGTTPYDLQFDISWENSWRVNSFYYDAAWVFVKASVNDGAWQHVAISDKDLSGAAGTGLKLDVAADNKGAFLYRAADGTGTLSATGIKLKLSRTGILFSSAKIKIQVFAIEMVHVPQGAFYVGSGGTESGSFTDGTWSGTEGTTPTIPFKVTSEAALTINTGSGNLWGTATSGNSTIGITGILSDNSAGLGFPKGFNAFYCMKYEITQGQYRDFLNTLTRAQQAMRVQTSVASGVTLVTNRYVMSNSSAVSYRNGIKCDGSIHNSDPLTFYCDLQANDVYNESTDGEWIACSYLKWADLCAYADWAALRPMTELEFEKACRGAKDPVADEYAWGSTSITKTTGVLTNPGTSGEIATLASANCNINTSGVGPLRCGFAAKSSSNRESSGGSFYGIMNLSDNLYERAVTVGNATGRLFAGAHGDGALTSSTDGNANVTAWPGTNATGAGYRGDDWYGVATLARVSDRIAAAKSDSGRDYSGGGRCVRTK